MEPTTIAIIVVVILALGYLGWAYKEKKPFQEIRKGHLNKKRWSFY